MRQPGSTERLRSVTVAGGGAALLSRLAVFLMLCLLTGCGTVGYYAQAIHGQFQILHREQPIQKLLADPGKPAGLKQRLTRALAIRENNGRAVCRLPWA